MDAQIGHALLRAAEKLVLGAEALKCASAQSIAFQISNPFLGFSLVFGGPWLARKQSTAIVSAEPQQLGIELRITPVGPLHRSAQVVEVHDPGHTTEGAKRVLQTPNQAFGGLLKDRFTVTLAREAQNHAQYPGPSPPSIGIDHGGSPAEIKSAPPPPVQPRCARPALAAFDADAAQSV